MVSIAKNSKLYQITRPRINHLQYKYLEQYLDEYNICAHLKTALINLNFVKTILKVITISLPCTIQDGV